MRHSILPAAVLCLSACIRIKDSGSDTTAAKIDTSSGALAVASGRVDSTPTTVVPRTGPDFGPDSVTMIRGMGSVEARTALRNDSTVTLSVVDSSPAAAPNESDLTILRYQMQVPVAGFSWAMLHDTYDEMRGGTRRHEALDILAARGTPVLSATTGRVLKLFDSKAGGKMVYAADSTERFILMYAHLDAYQPGLAEGQPLRRGQQLGIVGTSGNAPATVPHLHFAVARSTDVRQWWKGTPVNPYPLLKP